MVPENGPHSIKPFLGAAPFLSTRMRPFFDGISRPQVRASWHWFHFLLQELGNSEPLILNLDETSVKYYYTPRRGLQLRAPQPRFGQTHRRNVSKSQQRKAFTHVAVVCNDSSIQPQLPQICLVAHKLLPLREYRTLTQDRTHNVHIWRRTSGWINADVFCEILTELAKALQKTKRKGPWLLLMDAHSVHYKELVLKHAARCNFLVCILPASCTHVVQPLDTDGFAKYKAHLRSYLHKVATQGANSDWRFATIWEAVVSATRHVLNATVWQTMFSNKWLHSGPPQQDSPPRSRWREPAALRDRDDASPGRVSSLLPER